MSPDLIGGLFFRGYGRCRMMTHMNVSIWKIFNFNMEKEAHTFYTTLFKQSFDEKEVN
jgi:hypothetical protein